MKPSAKIIADSISPRGYRLTTMEVTFHRFVLAEFNTHRRFSRNSASSRAIPIRKRLAEVWNSLAWPMEWGSNRPGMQAGAELTGWRLVACRVIWKLASLTAIAFAWLLHLMGLHKQVANRLLEPFLWHTAVVSSTEWENFFAQRCSPLAQPEIRAVAEAMRAALTVSTPNPLQPGDWHLPYVDGVDWVDACGDMSVLQKFSVARCARVSYLNQDGKRNGVSDIALYSRLLMADPPHASPFEHVARIATNENLEPNWDCDLDTGGNFDGWVQLRAEVFLGANR